MGDEPAWTPGPWAAQIGHSDWGMPCSHIIVKDGDTGNSVDEWIAEIHSETPYVAGATRRQREHSAKQIANAQLIAAAPDLYEALEALCGAQERGEYAGHPAWAVAFDALTKARGESA